MRLWDVETGACVKTLEGHGHDVNSVCFSPDGKQVASGGDDSIGLEFVLVHRPCTMVTAGTTPTLVHLMLISNRSSISVHLAIGGDIGICCTHLMARRNVSIASKGVPINPF